ncbi:hypothetical protein HDU83_003493 [Entophlyctis luteolus]|nr:hypothetical protein HDU83_003493 [Entophlyctis luteolus]
MPALPYVYLVARAAEIILNARDNTTIASIYMDPTNDTEIANGTGTLLFNDSSRVSIAPNMNRPNFNLPGSQQGSMLNMSSPIQIVNQETMYIFAAYIMMQGVFLGMAIIFLYQSMVLHIPRRSWLTFVNVAQLLLYIARTLIIIVFNIVPGFLVDCRWRQTGAGVVSQAIVLCTWWWVPKLQYIKFESMYRTRPNVCRCVLGLCIFCSAASFPYLQTAVGLDNMDHCNVVFNPLTQALYISADVIVNLTLSVLFAGAIIRHVLETDAESWTPHAQLLYVLRCDVRGAFIDTVAQVVKLVLNLCAGGNTVVFGSHVCDFVKIACAHWFVGDVVLSIGGGKNAASGGIGPSGGGGGGSRGTGHTAGAAVNVQQVSARRKGSFGTRTSQYFKDTDKSGGYTGSLDTLKAISAEKLNVRQPPPLSPAGSARMLTAADSVRGRSIESLRATSSPLGEAALRSARSSDHVNMFSRK